MSQVWVTSTNGDLLRTDQIRQVNVVDGLRAVLIGGNQFVLATAGNRQESTALARELTSAIAEAEARGQWAEISVVCNDQRWSVEVKSVRDIEGPATTA